MSIRVGMPTMKLNRCKGVTAKHTGNATAVACEALKERWTSDPDFDPSRTKDNIYLTSVTSGLELVKEWSERADNYTVTMKNGKTRALRADAHIGFGGICKPAIDSDFGSMPRDKQIQFCKDSFTVLLNLYAKYGLKMDYGVIHLDEGNPHLHYGGHDPDFKVGEKIKLKLFTELNRGYYVEEMQKRGWNIEPLKGEYDPEAAAQMTDDEKTAYKEEVIERKRKKKKNGRTAKQYKADAEADKTIARAEAEAEQIKQDAQDIQDEAQRQAEQVQADREQLETDQQALAEKQEQDAKDFQAREDKLEQQKRIQDDRQQQQDDREQRQNERDEQLYAEVSVKKGIFGVFDALKQYKSLNEQIEVLQQRSDRQTIYDSDLQAARQARSDAERLRDAAAERTAAQQEHQAAQAEKERYERLKQQEENKIQQEVDSKIEQAVSDAEERTKIKMRSVYSKKLKDETADTREQNKILQERVERYQSYLQDRHLTQDYNKWDYNRRGRFDGVADTKQNTYTFDYDAGE